MKKLYDGFDLLRAKYIREHDDQWACANYFGIFMNTAIDQQVLKKESELKRKLTAHEQAELEKWTLTQVRGTVQADILKEDQGQNTCIFSIDFALKMMGDIQEFLCKTKSAIFIRSVFRAIISPKPERIRLANWLLLKYAFTFVEYYLAARIKNR